LGFLFLLSLEIPQANQQLTRQEECEKGKAKRKGWASSTGLDSAAYERSKVVFFSFRLMLLLFLIFHILQEYLSFI
jgi:hypothetical protein